jgi:hypothetical protein
MRLPLSSSLPSVGSSDDGALARQLLLAGTNAEVNRISCGEFDNESDVLSSPRTPNPRFEKLINFNPQVSVRFIRARSNTMHSSFSDLSGSLRYLDSPIAPDATQQLKECYQDSDDEEFDRFYRTMEYPPLRPQVCTNRARRLSLDHVDENTTSYVGSRARSVSCDDMVFQSMKLGG